MQPNLEDIWTLITENTLTMSCYMQNSCPFFESESYHSNVRVCMFRCLGLDLIPCVIAVNSHENLGQPDPRITVSSMIWA